MTSSVVAVAAAASTGKRSPVRRHSSTTTRTCTGAAAEASRKLSAPASEQRLRSARLCHCPPPRAEQDNPALSNDPSAARARGGTFRRRCPSRTTESKSSRSCPRDLRRSSCGRRRPSSLGEGEAAESHRTGRLERPERWTSKTRRTAGATNRRKGKQQADDEP